MIGPAIDGLTAGAAVWLAAELLKALDAWSRALSVQGAAARTRAAELRRRLAEAKGSPDLPARDARPAAWMTPDALDAAALDDVLRALTRLRETFGEAPSVAECAAMLMLVSREHGVSISGDAPPIQLAARSARAARRRHGRPRP
ncbi:MAG: hypothetical protein ACK4WC_10835 [Rubrimonas sp.]